MVYYIDSNPSDFYVSLSVIPVKSMRLTGISVTSMFYEK